MSRILIIKRESLKKLIDNESDLDNQVEKTTGSRIYQEGSSLIKTTREVDISLVSYLKEYDRTDNFLLNMDQTELCLIHMKTVSTIIFLSIMRETKFYFSDCKTYDKPLN